MDTAKGGGVDEAMPSGQTAVRRAIHGPGRNLLGRMLEGRGYRRLSVAYSLGVGLRMAPDFVEKTRLGEQIGGALQDFAVASDIYGGLGVGDLLFSIKHREPRFLVPDSWPEVLLAHAFLDGACQVQLRADCSALKQVEPEVLAKFTATGIDSAAGSRLQTFCTANPGSVPVAQEGTVRWLKAALTSLGWSAGLSPSGGGHSSMQCGMGSCGTIRDYLAAISQLCAACGLRFPASAALRDDEPKEYEASVRNSYSQTH